MKKKKEIEFIYINILTFALTVFMQTQIFSPIMC